MNESKSKLRPILILIAAILLGAFIALYFYVNNVSKYNPLTGIYYYTDPNESLESLLVIVENGEFSLVFASPTTSHGYYRINYSYTQNTWKKFTNNLYFASNSLLSLRKADYEGTPATVKLKFINGYSTDIFFSEVVELTENDVQSPVTEIVYHTKDGIYFMEDYLKEVPEIPEDMLYICNLLN